MLSDVCRVLAHRARLGRPGSRLPLRASVAWGGAFGGLTHSLFVVHAHASLLVKVCVCVCLVSDRRIEDRHRLRRVDVSTSDAVGWRSAAC